MGYPPPGGASAFDLVYPCMETKPIVSEDDVDSEDYVELPEKVCWVVACASHRKLSNTIWR